MNTKRGQPDSQWYEFLLHSESKTNDLPSENPSPASSLNNSVSQSTVDKVVWSRARTTSAGKSCFDLTNSLGRQKADIDGLLAKNPNPRPLSVILGKYNPLPAISQTINSNSSSNICSKGEISSPNDEPFSENGSSFKEPPKLERSRTFEVIETNLSDLPSIETCDSDVSSNSDYTEGIINDCNLEDLRNTEEPNEEDSKTIKDVVNCSLTVDGMPILEYIAHERRKELHSSLAIVNMLDGYSRPPSRSSLITHPGTPDRRVSLHDIRALSPVSIKKSPKASRYAVWDEGLKDDFGSRTNEFHYIKFPDDNLIALRWTNQSFKELVKKIEGIKFQKKPIKICDLEQIKDDFDEPLYNLGINQTSTINLLVKELT